MKYCKYCVQDFVKDCYFQQWVISPDDETNIFWENWLKNNPEKKEVIEEARQIIQVLGFRSDYEANTHFIQVWQNINIEINTKEAAPAVANYPQTKSALTHQVQKLAAVFLGLLLISFSVCQFWIKDPLNVPVSYETTYGEIKHVVLPDGSKVFLNSNSHLTFRREWSSQVPREVWLTGEAYFSVVKKENGGNSKFKVHANKVTVEVLGTQFNVSDRRNTTKVVLASGKIKLSVQGVNKHIKQHILLLPGEYAQYKTLQQKLSKAHVDPSHYTSWINNKIHLQKTPLREIGYLLEDNYGLKVNFADDAIAKQNFTGSFPRNDYKFLLDMLAILYDLEIVQQHNEITITPKSNTLSR